jgi:hypothetical protein
VAKGRPVVEFHVIPHGGRWEIARDDAFTGQFAHEAAAAVHLAIAAAQREAAGASVCIQEPDGTCRHVWP